MKSDPDPHLIALATRIADGARVDWDRDTGDPTSDLDRELIEGLRLLERVADVHAGWSTETPPDRRHEASADPAFELAPLLQQWGPLLLQARIGHGSFGEVYRAWDPRLDRAVALKLLAGRSSPSLVADTPSDTTIVDEARLMARVRHEGVVTVFGADQFDGRVGIWMELIEGQTLDAVVRERGPLPASEIAAVGVRLGDALGAVHAAGLIHRDIKAQNVMLEPSGRLVLMDFGTGVGPARVEHAASLAGTPLYLAPEVLEGAEATRQSDVYSLGVLLYFLATGTFPVAGGTLRAIRRAHARRERTGLPLARPDVPRGLARIIERATAVSPRQRFADARGLEQALRHYQRRLHLRRLALRAAAASVVVAAGGFAWLRFVAGTNSFPSESGTTGLVHEQIQPDLQTRATIQGPAVSGRFAPCLSRNPAAVAVCDLRAGTVTVVRHPRREEYFLSRPAPRVLLNPDGSRLAYLLTRRIDGKETDHLVVADIDGGKARELYSADVMQLTRWAREGDAVIARAGRDDQGRYVRVSTTGVGHRDLLRLTSGDDGWGDLSPDGRTLLVTHYADEASGRSSGIGSRDLVAFDVATGTELWRRGGPNDDYHGRWSLDGTSVVFASNARGCDALYQQRLEAGRPAGSATYLADVGRRRPFLYGFGSRGDLLIGYLPPPFSVFEADLDLSRHALSDARLVGSSNCDVTMGAAWSPRADRLAFLSARHAPGGRAAIVVQGAEGRERAEIALVDRAVANAQLRWSPGGEALAITYGTSVGPSANYSTVLMTLDLVSQRFTEHIRRRDAIDHLRDPRWDPSGRSVYVRQGNDIVRVDSPALRRTVFRPPAGENLANGFDVSRSADLVVATERPSGGEPLCVLRVLAAPDAAVRHTMEVPGVCQSVEWTNDARLLVGVSAPSGAGLWVVDPATRVRAPIAADVAEPNFWDMSLSADGRRLVFTAGRPAARQDMSILKGIR